MHRRPWIAILWTCALVSGGCGSASSGSSSLAASVDSTLAAAAGYSNLRCSCQRRADPSETCQPRQRSAAERTCLTRVFAFDETQSRPYLTCVTRAFDAASACLGSANSCSCDDVLELYLGQCDEPSERLEDALDECRDDVSDDDDAVVTVPSVGTPVPTAGSPAPPTTSTSTPVPPAASAPTPPASIPPAAAAPTPPATMPPASVPPPAATPPASSTPPAPTTGVPSTMTVSCGSNTCSGLALGNSSGPCCVDAGAGVCGFTSAGACMPRPAVAPLCPSAMVFNMSVAACCVANNECGVDASALGMGCAPYSSLPAGTTAPPPTRCDGTPIP
jgi:hypothetical protein